MPRKAKKASRDDDDNDHVSRTALPTVSGRFSVEEDRMLLEAVAEIVGTHELGKDTLNVRVE